MKKVAMLHTSAATLTMMQQLIADIMPDVEVIHLVEESMIKQVMKAQGVTPNTAMLAACSQWVSGGLWKNGRPSRRGVSQSPDTSIQRLMSA